MTLSHLKEARKSLAAAEGAYKQGFLHMNGKCMDFIIMARNSWYLFISQALIVY